MDFYLSVVEAEGVLGHSVVDEGGVREPQEGVKPSRLLRGIQGQILVPRQSVPDERT